MADHSSRGVLPRVVCLTECDREASIMRRTRPLRDFAPRKTKCFMTLCGLVGDYHDQALLSVSLLKYTSFDVTLKTK